MVRSDAQLTGRFSGFRFSGRRRVVCQRFARLSQGLDRRRRPLSLFATLTLPTADTDLPCVAEQLSLATQRVRACFPTCITVAYSSVAVVAGNSYAGDATVLGHEMSGFPGLNPIEPNARTVYIHSHMQFYARRAGIQTRSLLFFVYRCGICPWWPPVLLLLPPPPPPLLGAAWPHMVNVL